MTFKAFKIRVPTPEISEEVQLAAFDIGYRWGSSSSTTPRYTEHPFLFFSTSGHMSWASLGEEHYFNSSVYPEIVCAG